MQETVGDRIKRLRLERGLTQEDLGRLCYTSKQTIYKYETNVVTNIPLPRLALLAHALGTTPSELAQLDGYIPDGFETLPSLVHKPLLGSIACGEPIEAQQQTGDTVAVPSGIHCDYALRCRGDSMLDAGIRDGDIVYIKAQPSVDDGQIAAVVIGTEATLKRVYTTDSVVTLMPCNIKYSPIVFPAGSRDDIRIMGRAVGFTHVI